MSSQNRSISSAFLVVAAVFALCAGAAQAEEGSRNEQPPEKPHFYQPGSGYEQEPEYKFSGVIKKMPEKGTAGKWVIDDRLIVVTPMTVINEKLGKATVGTSVAVKGVLQGIDFMALGVEVDGSGKTAP
jgi:hypothetical protein